MERGTGGITMSLEPKYIYKNHTLVYGVYKHNVQMFYDLNDNLVSPKDYFDTHINVDHLYFLDIHTNILYLFNRNDGNEYKISYDFADKVFSPYFRDIVDGEKYDQQVLYAKYREKYGKAITSAAKGIGLYNTK